MNRHISLLLLSIGLAPIASPAYKVQTVTYPGATATAASATNSAGVTVGYYKDSAGSAHGFLLSDGTVSAFDIKRASGTWVTGINDNNEIAGYFENTGATEGFTALKDSIVPFTVPKTTATLVSALNNTGEVAGTVQGGTTEAPVYGGYYETDPGTSTPVAILASKTESTWVGGLSSLGDIVGYTGANLKAATPVHAFIYSAASGKIETVTDSSMVQIRFNGINAAGVVVGLSVDSKAAIHPFIYQNGAFTALSLSGLKDIVPLSINDAGVITGFAVSGSTTVGFVATP